MASILLVVELLAEVHEPYRYRWLHISQAPVGAEVLVALGAYQERSPLGVLI
jgi:hypothetical protein